MRNGPKLVSVLIALFSVSLFSCIQPADKDIGLQLYSVRDDMKADKPQLISE